MLYIFLWRIAACKCALPVRHIDFGLRDYGTATWEGGDAECDHKKGTLQSGKTTLHPGTNQNDKRNFDGMPYHDTCAKCGSVRIDNQIGLEPSPEEYVEKLVQVFREVWRVLRDDGVLFLNLGDSYNGSGGAGGDYTVGGLKEGQPRYPGRKINTLKPKDLIGIPWRVAFGLQADGWYLRQDIIWAKAISGVIRKGSAMPESVRDRFCKSHEYIFLLTKKGKILF